MITYRNSGRLRVLVAKPMINTTEARMPSPFVARLGLRNYRSIGMCDAPLQRLTVFVGPNGAGKSNILDSLRFVSDSLRHSVEFALQCRGGINEVRRRSKGHPTHFGIRLDLNMPDGGHAVYAFQVGASPAGGFTVQEEKCRIVPWKVPAPEVFYHVAGGEVKAASGNFQSAIEPDRLYLGAVSALPEFRPLYDAFCRMGFYSFNPDRMRDYQDADAGEMLKRDGSNIPSILRRLGNSAAKLRIEEYLGAVVPGLKSVSVRPLGPKETVEFRQEVPGDTNPWRFLASNMSDGTLRVLGILVALFQAFPKSQKPIPLVGIEEPELALHPAATNALADAILESCDRTQVLLTSHSPDLLDNRHISSDSILAVVSDKGQTIVGPVDDASRKTLKDGLFTPGELLRMQQIAPNRTAFEQAQSQLDLFKDIPDHESHPGMHR